jgi:hypothetical protein
MKTHFVAKLRALDPLTPYSLDRACDDLSPKKTLEKKNIFSIQYRGVEKPENLKIGKKIKKFEKESHSLT